MGVFWCPRTDAHPSLNTRALLCSHVKTNKQTHKTRAGLLLVPVPSETSEQVSHSQNPKSSTQNPAWFKRSLQRTLKNSESGPSSMQNSSYWRSGLRH